MRTVLALLSHGYLPYSVASGSKLLETSRGLGTGGPAAPRHRGQGSAPEGEKVRNVAHGREAVSAHKVLETLFQTQFWSKNTVLASKIGVTPSRFGEIAI